LCECDSLLNTEHFHERPIRCLRFLVVSRAPCQHLLLLYLHCWPISMLQNGRSSTGAGDSGCCARRRCSIKTACMLLFFYSCSLLRLSKGVFTHPLWHVHSYAAVKRTIFEVLRPQGDSYRGVDMLFLRNPVSSMLGIKCS
jgi:hypothetical protein